MPNSSARISDSSEAGRDTQRIKAAIASGGTNAAQIAGTVVGIYAHIETALAPIIGSRGIAALCKRSVYVAGQTHPWLRGPDAWLLGPHADLQAALDLEALRSAIAAQDNAEAAAGAGFLLQTFCEVLTRLVGASLTERLLSSVWPSLSSSAPAQDIAS